MSQLSDKELIEKYKFDESLLILAKKLYQNSRPQNVTSCSWNGLSNGEKLTYLVKAEVLWLL